MERKMIDYIPAYLHEFKEMQEIMNTEQASVEYAWSKIEQALHDQFISDATEYGISRYEKILKITPKATDTLDERRFRIYARLNEQIPYTRRALENILESLCGADGYKLIVQHQKYRVIVRLDVKNESNFNDVIQMLDRVLPANLTKSVTLLNTHEMMIDKKHGELSTYTHEQLRKDEIYE